MTGTGTGTGRDSATGGPGTGPERGPERGPVPAAYRGLLDHITATSLDEDYAAASRRHQSSGGGRARRKLGVVGLVVLAVFGVLVATAAVETSRNADVSESSRAALIERVQDEQDTLSAQRDLLVELQGNVDAMVDSNLDATTQGRAARAQLRRLGVTTGAAATSGPGIEVTVDDAPNASSEKEEVHGQDLQRLVNGLWESGAEAISVNGQRLTALSPIRDAGEAITVNFVSLRPPYVLSAIGDPDQMAANLLETSGGQTWLTLQSTFGLQFDATTEESMNLPAARPFRLRHARQPERIE
jgi:uncharacterized protein YlxW (UPF0749 family)